MIIIPSEGFLVEENNQNFEKLGPILPVRLFLSEADRKVFTQDNKKVPPPQDVYALIDTGASHCFIDISLVDELKLKAGPRFSGETLTGKTGFEFSYFVRVCFKTKSLSAVWDASRSKDPYPGSIDGCLAGPVKIKNRPFQFIIGRNLLKLAELKYNGRNNNVELRFFANIPMLDPIKRY